MRPRIRVGTCSWTDPSLINCERFYPKLHMSAEQRLRYYAEHFPMVEVDSSYYALPDPRMVELQVARTPDDFVLHYKAYGLFTGHKVDSDKLPKAIKELLSPDILSKRRLTPADLPRDIRQMCVDWFVGAMGSAQAAGKLGLLLFQFPPWFEHSEAAKESILRTAARFTSQGFRLAVEFRHGSWMLGDAADDTLSFLDHHGFVYVSVDEPQFADGSTVPSLLEVTGGQAYIRLHGRNRTTWFKNNATPADRFKYLYSEEELGPWAHDIMGLRTADADGVACAPQVDVLFNNNWEDFSIRNALTMKSLLT